MAIDTYYSNWPTVSGTTTSGWTGFYDDSGQPKSLMWAVADSDATTVSNEWKKWHRVTTNYPITQDMLAEAWHEGAAAAASKSRSLSKGVQYDMPDGSRLVIDDAGNYRIEDQDAKVTYQANRVREFSPYLNASDMLAKFVEYVGTLGVRRSDVLGLPIHLFISWLVIEAAERDGDVVPDDVIPVNRDPALLSIRNPRCQFCGKYIKRLHQRCDFPFCNPEHAQRKLLLTVNA